MISESLNRKIQMIEMVIFPVWQEANQKKRREIEKKLGMMEGNMIINEIKNESAKLINNR